MLIETLKRHWWVPVLRGILAILFGIIAFAIKVRREVKGEWLLILLGLLSIAFAVLLLWNPLLGAATLIWLIAWYAIVFGILGIILGFRLRSLPTIPVR